MWPSLEGGLERATAEKTLALPEAVMSNGCIAKGGTSCPPPHCMLRFCLAWAGTGLLPAASIAVSPFVQLSCYIQKTLFPFSHLPPSVLQSFCPLVILNTKWKRVTEDEKLYEGFETTKRGFSFTCLFFKMKGLISILRRVDKQCRRRSLVGIPRKMC